MAREKSDVPAAVHEFLSRNGQKGAKIGGKITQSLIEYAKMKLEEEGISLSEFEEMVDEGTWRPKVTGSRKRAA